MGEKSGIWSWLWVHKIVLTGGLPPPDPLQFLGGFQPPRPGGPAAPRAPSQIFERLRLSSSPFFWYQSFNAQVRQVRRFEPEPPNLIFFETGSNLWTAMKPGLDQILEIWEPGNPDIWNPKNEQTWKLSKS